MEKSELEILQENNERINVEKIVLDKRYVQELQRSVQFETHLGISVAENEKLKNEIEELKKTIAELKFQ